MFSQLVFVYSLVLFVVGTALGVLSFGDLRPRKHAVEPRALFTGTLKSPGS